MSTDANVIPQLSGSWTVDVRWTDGSQGKVDITFNTDGTCSAALNQLKGRWFQVGERATFAFAGYPGLTDWSLVYNFTLNKAGTRFSGLHGYTHTSGDPRGEHTATRTATAESRPDDLRAAIGPATK